MRAMETVTFSREDLYKHVWSTPMRKLAEQFGLSDVGLAKVCDKYAVPRPGRGYWAQLAAGKKPRRPKLAKVPDGVGDTIVLQRVSDPNEPRTPPPEVAISKVLVAPHAAVAWLQQAFKSAKADEHGRLIVGHAWDSQACIRGASVPRALLLLDGLFKALIERGHAVQAKPRGEGPLELTVTAFGEDLRLRLEEKLAKKDHVLTAEERERKERWKLQARKYDYFPDGELVIRVEGAHYKYVGRKSWSDTKRQRLDELLGHLLLTVEEIAEFNRREHVAAEEHRRLCEEHERRRRRGERLGQWQVWLGTELTETAAQWRAARDVREFLDAYDAKVPSAGRDEATATWLAAARRFAERLDPLSAPEKVARELEPSDEVLAAFAAELQKAEEERRRAEQQYRR
jgi:hypothetical protein